MPENPSSFANILITWYLKHKRTLPWRNESNPYYIWLSEIILQQTRVDQGLPYYLKFVERFPSIFDLAVASEEEILKLWQGLGYYSRARNLHFTAKQIAFEFDGTFPPSYSELKKLKGIGDYTASAIASICFDEAAAVVDGNVYRVLSRVFGIDTPINSSAGAKTFKSLAQQLIDVERPGTFNQALMEFGARHCVPQNPDCNRCVFSGQCEAVRTGTVSDLPAKLKKQQIRKRYFNYIVLISDEQEATLLQQRKGKGIWQNLYEFPLIETTSVINEAAFCELTEYKALSENASIAALSLYNEDPVVHKLSHQHLYTTFWIASTEDPKVTVVPFSEVQNYPVPVLIENFISEFSVFKN
jgi:A/G-specific adenine glycosylase